MARGAEARAGDQQQVKFLGPFTEGHVVGLQGPGEEIEGSAGLGHIVAHLPQAAAEQVEAAHRTWEQHRGISASLVDHQRLEDIDQGFTDLQAWFQLGEEAEFAQSCLALAQQVRAMADAEKPYYYNIL